MLKKIFVYLTTFFFLGSLTISAADNPSRLRLYSPISTNATVDSDATATVTASGYSLHYVFGFGLGLGTTSSKSKVKGESSEYTIDSGSMIDISYTFGSEFSFTLGYGVGSQPVYENKSMTINSQTGNFTNSLLGFGYNLGGFEILLGYRMVRGSMEIGSTIDFMGTPIPITYKFEDISWDTTDIGFGFTF